MKVVMKCIVTLVIMVSNLFAISFEYNDFLNASGLNLIGTAEQISNYVRVTPSLSQQYGAVWHQSMHNIGEGFSTNFEFRYSNIGGILDENNNVGVDGTSFFIQATANDVLDIVPLSCQDNPRLQIVFDAFDNGHNNISSSTVRIRLNEIEINEVDVENYGILFRDEEAHQVSIDYNGFVLRIYLDNLEVASCDNIDLTALGLGNSYVGFQSYGGGAYSDQELLSWAFIPEPTSLSLLLLGLVSLKNRRIKKIG